MNSGITYHDADTMTGEERVAEIGRILAAGYLRVVRRRAANPLEPFAEESAHGANTESAKEVA